MRDLLRSSWRALTDCKGSRSARTQIKSYGRILTNYSVITSGPRQLDDQVSSSWINTHVLDKTMNIDQNEYEAYYRRSGSTYCLQVG
jgi:hypothetical protein